jgi:alkyl hydroperoxide reductase subunit AhpC
VELQQNLEAMRDAGIAVFAISPDAVDVLGRFAEKFGITYRLLSDADAEVIRAFGILNDDIAEDHEHYGLPRPGTYLIGEDGRVFDKTFYEGHNVRDAINDVLRDDFAVARAQTGPAATANRPNARVTASFASATIRRAQSLTLTVEVDIAAGKRLYGPPGADGCAALDIRVEGGDAITLLDVRYPTVDGTAPAAYEGRVVVKAICRGVNEDRDEDVGLTVRVSYQACDDTTRYTPEEAAIPLSLYFLPHDWERV